MRKNRDEKNLEIVRNQPCMVCGAPPKSQPHHLQTRGANGDDSLENLMPLCFGHHRAVHDMGSKSFVAAYKLPVSWESGWPRRTDLPTFSLPEDLKGAE